jgi:hypothetical protein
MEPSSFVGGYVFAETTDQQMTAGYPITKLVSLAGGMKELDGLGVPAGLLLEPSSSSQQPPKISGGSKESQPCEVLPDDMWEQFLKSVLVAAPKKKPTTKKSNKAIKGGRFTKKKHPLISTKNKDDLS